jgi:hypothetical protein
MTRLLPIAFAAVLLAVGCNGSGAHEAGPVPTSASSGTSSVAHKAAETASQATPGTSTSEAAPPIPLCSDRAAAVKLAAQEGAAGTLRTVWRVRNTAEDDCQTRGYPGMDFRASSGWLDVHVARGGYPDINEPPAPVVLAPGQSLHFVSYWGDVGSSGPCTEFDRVKVTLPDNTISARVAASGCLNPDSVHVGPVAR